MIEAIKKHKRIVAAVVILILTAAIELVCNFPAIRGGYDNIDLTKYITVEENSIGGTKKYIISYTPSKKNYIKEIKIGGEFDSIGEYIVEVTEYNSFGKEIEKKYADRVNAVYSEFYTTINKNIKTLKLTMDLNENSHLYSVTCSNKFSFNKYRMFFCISLFSLLYLFIFEKKVYNKIEYVFVVYTLLFGLMVMIYSQPRFGSWDEKIHFESAYSLAYGEQIQWTEGISAVQQAGIMGCNTKEEFKELRDYINSSGTLTAYTERKDSILPSYKVLAYIPQALFLRIGISLNLPFTYIYILGKFGNLLLYVFVMFWAIHLAKSKKILLTFVAMMPTSIFLASSYTYDTVVFSFITLGCVLWANEFFYPKAKKDVRELILMILLFVIGCFSKAVYIPLILILLILPIVKQKSKKKKAIFWIGLLIVFALVMMTFVLPTLTSTVTKNVSFGGDARGGDTGVVRQIISMIKHPWASIKLMLSSVVQLDNFRNLGYAEADNYFFGNLMFLNFASHGILNDKWCLVWIPIFVLLMFYREPGEKIEQNRMRTWDMIVIAVAGIGTIFLIWLALYLDFTPIGEDYISGVQARYYLPLVYFGVSLIRTKKISIQCDRVKLSRVMIVAVTIMGFALIYQGMLQGFLV